MGKYDFDRIIDRKNTSTVKYGKLNLLFGRENLAPLWVADMDFVSANEIIEAIKERVEHGVFGYTMPDDGYYDAIINWTKNVHDWEIKQEWMSFIPGIVKGIAFAIDCFLAKDQKVIIQPPVYHPFRIIPTLHNREIAYNPLVLTAGRYAMDLDNLKKVIDTSCKMLILCNPHNPGGRVWTKQELVDIAEICHENEILVISDEIHCDLTFAPNKHIPFASVSEKAAQNSITFMAPSKTFNIAGICSSFSVVPNDALRQKFQKYLSSSELDSGHIFAYVAAEAAYRCGGEWLQEVKSYIWDNIRFVDDYLKTNIPQIKAMIPEASFLVWLDCRNLNLSQENLVTLFVNDAHLALNDGTMFGQGGEGFMRLNVGTPRKILEEALSNLKEAVLKVN